MQAYGARASGTTSSNVLANLYANGGNPSVYYIQVGISQSSPDGISPFGIKMGIFRTPDAGTSGITDPGKLLNASGDSLSDSIARIKSGFSIDPTLNTKMFDMPFFFKDGVEWEAKKGKQIKLTQTQGLAAQVFQSGALTTVTYGICYQFEE